MGKHNNFFTDKAAIKTIDSKRITYFVIAVLFFVKKIVKNKVIYEFE